MNFEEKDVTSDAQVIITCIKESGERYGIKMIIDILRGSKNQKLIANKLNKLSTYGLLAAFPENKIRDIINYLVLKGFIEITNSEYPVVKLYESTSKILFENYRVHMKAFKHDNYYENKPNKNQHKDINTIVVHDLFEKLRLLRNKISSTQGVPAYIVFTDASLRDMCKKIPINDAGFLEVVGVGQAKLKKYGEAFLKEIKTYINQHKETVIEKNITKGNLSAHKAWSIEEDEKLKFEYENGIKISEISKIHGRTSGAIRSRLKKLDILE